MTAALTTCKACPVILQEARHFFSQVQLVDYKGDSRSVKKYIPYSEYSTMRFGDGRSKYWYEATMKHLRRHLDMPLETSLGYFYTDIFNRCATNSPPGSLSLSCQEMPHTDTHYL